jgi:hypothetical protein
VTYNHPCLINTDARHRVRHQRHRDRGGQLRQPVAPGQDRPQGEVGGLHRHRRWQGHKTSVWAFIQWHQSGAAKPAKVVQNETGANGGWTGTGDLILKSFSLKGARGDYQEFDATFVPASPFVFAQNA